VAESNCLAPVELSKAFVDVGEKKANLPIWKMFILGILAGCYIGFAAHLATTIGTGTMDYFGFKKLLMGAAFSVGLMLVVIPGAELFTGNSLMTVALCSGRITMGGVLRNWIVVFIGNLVGSILLAFIIAKSSGLLNGPVGATAIDIAATKTSSASIAGINHNLAFFCRGIGCNWLVCLAVMIAIAAKDIPGKILGCFFPVMAFVASGFEHNVANMYFIPAGIWAKGFPKAAEMATAAFATANPGKVLDLSALNWGSMWSQNLVSVTLGNIVGGAIFVGVLYFLAYVKGTDACDSPETAAIEKQLAGVKK